MKAGIAIDFSYFNIKVTDVIELSCASILIYINIMYPSMIPAICGIAQAAIMACYLKKRMEGTKGIKLIRILKEEDDDQSHDQE